MGRRARYKRRHPRRHNLCHSSISNSQFTPTSLTTSRVATVSATTRHPPQTSPTPHAFHLPNLLHACCVGLLGPHSPNGSHLHRRRWSRSRDRPSHRHRPLSVLTLQILEYVFYRRVDPLWLRHVPCGDATWTAVPGCTYACGRNGDMTDGPSIA